ncbi:hypothetical protein F0562_028190 [Nyssa sinensis]|uniref:Probable magnesium transporter n=1 Tax=Nyssa sinensis TaxID=561372 RepID=A0A5J5B8G0_9ASTE|nr:hypothetical protein F0562_028190 [Nyssa sinensis]
MSLLQALDTFNTAVVLPIYYVMFTSFTILASVIMFKDWAGQNATQIVTDFCGFVTIISRTFPLHKTNDMNEPSSPSISMSLSKHTEEDGFELFDHEELAFFLGGRDITAIDLYFIKRIGPARHILSNCN